MFWLAVVFLRHAAPPELKKIVAGRCFYKHAAPLELKCGCASVLLSRRIFTGHDDLPSALASSSPHDGGAGRGPRRGVI